MRELREQNKRLKSEGKKSRVEWRLSRKKKDNTSKDLFSRCEKTQEFWKQIEWTITATRTPLTTRSTRSTRSTTQNPTMCAATRSIHKSSETFEFSRKNFIALKQKNFHDGINNFFMNSKYSKTGESCEAHEKSLSEMEEFKKVSRVQNDANCVNDSRHFQTKSVLEIPSSRVNLCHSQGLHCFSVVGQVHFGN